MPAVILHMDDDRIALEVQGGGRLRNPTWVEAGSPHKIRERLRHEPATADELEAAISHIEDGLVPVIAKLPAQRRLATSAPEVWRIARVAGLSESAELRLETEAVELVFNRLAEVAYGRPAAAAGIPADRAFASALLFLRELLHHGGFESVTLE